MPPNTTTMRPSISGTSRTPRAAALRSLLPRRHPHGSRFLLAVLALLPGGVRGVAAYLGEQEEDPDGGLRWEPGARMPAVRQFHAAAAADGTVVVLGGGDGNGNTLASAIRYRPGAANTWTALPNMTTRRGYVAAATLNGTTVLALGGGSTGTSVEALDLAASAAGALRWTPYPSMTTPRLGHAGPGLKNLNLELFGTFHPAW